MTSSSSGWRALARPPLLLVTVLSLLLPALLLVPPPVRAVEGGGPAVAIVDGTVEWGVRASFRNYIGPEGVTVSDGLTQNDDGEFVFDVADGTYDPDNHALHLDLTGTVGFNAHGGALDMTFSNLEVTIDGEVQAITAEVVSKTLAGEVVDYGRVPLADLGIASTTPTVGAERTTWTDLTATLTEDAAPAFSGFYGTGAALDPVTIDYVGPGGKPVVTAERIVVSGAPQYEPAGEIDGLTEVTNLVADTERGVLHVQHRPEGAGSAVLQAYDYETLAPLDTPTFGAANGGYPGMTLDAATGAVLMALGEQVVVHVFDPAAGYTGAVVEPGVGAVQEISYDGLYRRVIVLGSAGLALLTASAQAPGYQVQTYTGLSFEGRESVASRARTSLVTTSAGVAPTFGNGARVITLSSATSTMTAEPLEGVADPKSTQPGVFDQPTMAFRDDRGVWLSAYTGDKTRLVSVGGKWTGGERIEAAGGTFLAERVETASDSVLMLDYSARRFRVWNGDGWTDVSVPGLGSNSFSNYLGADIGTDQTVFVASTTGDDRVLKYRMAGLAPAEATSPADQIVRLGKDDTAQEISLAAAFTGADAIRWQTRGSASGKWADVPDATGETLSWSATSEDNGRQFRVLATNEQATSASAVADLTVEFFPRVAAQPDSVTVAEGEDALFKVMPSGFPYPDITWQRWVSGFWENISGDDENVEIDGGFLTVLDADAEQTGTRFRARLSNVVGTTPTRAVELTVATPSAVRREISGGTLTWGVKESFRDYLAGPIAHGSVAVSRGVTQNADGTFTFPVTGGWSDPAQGTAEVRLGGTVRFTGHDGPPTCAVEHSPCLAVTISDPVLRLSGATGELVADVESKDETTHEIVSYPGVVLAEVDAAGWKAVGDRIAGGALPARLTGPGAAAFAGFYEAGAALDPITLDGVLGTDAGGPVVTPPPAAGKAAVELDWRFKKAKVRVGKRAVIRLDARLVGIAGAHPIGQVVVREGGKVRATGQLAVDRRGRLKIRLPRLAKGRHFLRLELAGNATQEPVRTAYRRLVVR
ncbi:HtaA domain-containing protein [Nocardioides sp. LHD-245]|uniref:HtaA domain-containing protein n=1 Tax=Nocardioides sp. LHD-245 TaxID=3051387 RepID=UPI0027E18D02|nr:HtaA domain-containing protein [Nocardioides sp. LHD-245]